MTTLYLASWLRNFKRNFVSLFIGVGGFALGIAVLILCLLFIHAELTFDGFHNNKDRIYRITLGSDDATGSAYTSHVLGQTARDNFADLTWVTFSNAGNARINFNNGERKFNESAFYFTSAEFFDVFSFKLIQGDPSSCLKQPFSVVLTPVAAARYFGNEDPIGKSLKVDWAGTMYDLNVTALMESPPPNSHLQFELLISYATAEKIFLPATLFSDWTANFQYNYILVPEPVDKNVVEQFLNRTYLSSVPEDQRTYNVRLQPLSRIHLHSRLSSEHSTNGNIMYIYVAGSLALLIILASAINYLNILLAHYMTRFRELGIRKVLGANKSDIGRQFTIESILNLGVSFTMSAAVIYFVTPFFSDLLHTDLSLSSTMSQAWLPLTVFVCLATVMSAITVTFLSRMRPVRLISDTVSLRSRGMSGAAMVGLQVAISLMLIVGSLAIHRQIRFMEEQELGFNKSDVVVVRYARRITRELQQSGGSLVDGKDVKEMSLSSQVPASNLNFSVRCFPEGGGPAGSSEAWALPMIAADGNFIETYGIEMVAGRSFSDEVRSDTTDAFLINESFANVLGWEDAVGKKIEINFNPGTGLLQSKRGTVVGVVRDVHFESLHKPIGPVIFRYMPTAFFYASFRLTEGNSAAKTEALRNKWIAMFPETPFNYFYLSDRVDATYTTERAWSSGISIFTVVAILISSLGIYGLLSFNIRRRTKEITIRKVMGASQASVVLILSSPILRLIVIAFLATIPICLYGLDKWLSNFAYRTTVGVEVFVGALLLFMIVSALAVAGNVLRGARAGIVENLRSE